MQNYQQLEPILILYQNYKAVKYINLNSIVEALLVGCRRNFFNADILVDEEFPGEGVLFEIRREKEANLYTLEFVKGKWLREDTG